MWLFVWSKKWSRDAAALILIADRKMHVAVSLLCMCGALVELALVWLYLPHVSWRIITALNYFKDAGNLHA